MKYHEYTGDTIAWDGAGNYRFILSRRLWVKSTRKTRRTHWIERDEIY